MFSGFFNNKRHEDQDYQQVPVYTGQPQPISPTNQPQQPQSSGIGSTMQPAMREEVTALSHLDPRAVEVLNVAQQETSRIKQAFIEPDQLLFALLFDKDIFKLLEQFNLKVADVSREIQEKEKIGTFLGQPTLSQDTKKIFGQAYGLVKTRSAEFITPEDLLISLMDANVPASAMLQAQGLGKEKIEEKLNKSGSTYTVVKKSFLDKFGIDLTEAARSGALDPVSERDKEVERVIHILLRRIKNNPIIIGEAGVGKTAIVEGLAQMIVQGRVPEDLKNKRIIQIDVASLVAGASHRGEFEDRLRSVIKEAQASSGQVIIFIDEIHTLMGTGDSDGALDASNIIKPFLARGQLQIIGSTTTIEYRHYFEKDKAFARRFQTVLCEEPSEESAIKMIDILKAKYERFHKVTLTSEAIAAAVKLSKRYIGERYLPDKAVDVIDEAAADVKLRNNTGNQKGNEVRKEDIDKVISNWTGIPVSKLTENESEKLLHLEDIIHKRMIDQERAVKSVAEAVRRGRIGLANVMRPIASFIFLGPSGTGKTELAKTLAEILFGKEDAMIRLDMSEYMEKHEVAKLIGAPPGYVGYEEGGQLTEAVRMKPYSVVLLDEVEKAHPDVFNILLQLLEDGRLTDNKGNTISFKNTIIICTSNIGSALIQQYLQSDISAKTVSQDTASDSVTKREQQGDSNEKKALDPNQAQKPIQDKEAKQKELQQLVSGELHKFFRPELINRFDEVIIFEPLGREVMVDITKLRIQSTRKLLLEQNIDIELTQKALEELAQEGYDPAYGARPLRRLVQSTIETPIASLILGKKFVAGDTIAIDYDAKEEKFVFTKSNKPAGSVAGAQAQEEFPVLRAVLRKLANPNVITDMTEHGQYLALRQTMDQASKQGDMYATWLLNIASSLVQTEQTNPAQAVLDLKGVLQKLLNPSSLLDPNEYQQYVTYKDRLTQEKAKGDMLASAMLDSLLLVVSQQPAPQPMQPVSQQQVQPPVMPVQPVQAKAQYNPQTESIVSPLIPIQQPAAPQQPSSPTQSYADLLAQFTRNTIPQPTPNINGSQPALSK